MDREDFRHPEKSPQRIDETVQVSGLSRILLTTLLKCRFIPFVYKCFLFSLAYSTREAEFPHEGSVELLCGRNINLFRV